MKKGLFILGLLLLVGFTINYWMGNMRESLKVGDPIPRIVLQNQNGETIHVNNYVGAYNLVIYFYPQDDTPGCTKEACGFRDSYEAFADLGAKVIGISSDNIDSHKAFSAKYNLPFDLLSDTEDSVRDAFGVPKAYGNLVPGRTTYIIDEEGIIQHVFNSATNAEEHVKVAQEILQNLKE